MTLRLRRAGSFGKAACGCKNTAEDGSQDREYHQGEQNFEDEIAKHGIGTGMIGSPSRFLLYY